MWGITEVVRRLKNILQPNQNCIHRYQEQFQLQTEKLFAVNKNDKIQGLLITGMIKG